MDYGEDIFQCMLIKLIKDQTDAMNRIANTLESIYRKLDYQLELATRNDLRLDLEKNTTEIVEWPEITAETPLEEVQKIHKQIWQYVIEHHGKKPETIPYPSTCVLCEYAKRLKLDTDSPLCQCYYCPAKWPYDLHCMSSFSLYDSFCAARDRSGNELLIEKYATDIRDIPFKTKKEILEGKDNI